MKMRNENKILNLKFEVFFKYDLLSVLNIDGYPATELFLDNLHLKSFR